MRQRQFNWLVIRSIRRGELPAALAMGWQRPGRAAMAQPYFELQAKETPGSVYVMTAHTWLEKQTLPTKIACGSCHAQ
jgi:hypothetical protein